MRVCYALQRCSGLFTRTRITHGPCAFVCRIVEKSKATSPFMATLGVVELAEDDSVHISKRLVKCWDSDGKGRAFKAQGGGRAV